ncbi:efflux RND transporter periplasmic adaptor subunit [Paenibacillus arenilitoris]|uniref:Efflux RND transporter periplasmic adaptor subunit n=1 Tax=Paenibacillus arenilitoris TaxID=2772299 RepID=A0A927H8A1_9BACL|nr:efflux RND transporter periplasmic adaptor subunit [Paenibacillus arenilitoris]MBD2871352.1 efflux RND transporter periplasmic adaptor subunit [Paenibacillus arenilitoris]
MQRRKQALRWLIGFFFLGLLALTFLSNTIQGLSLPKVSVDKPDTGGLDLTVTGEGFLEPGQTAQLYPEGDWKVERVLKSKNDRVKRGDPLVTFDTSSTERTLQDERTRYEQQKLQLDKMADQLKTMLREGDPVGIDNQKRDIEMQQLDMQVQERKIADLQKLIAEGGTLKSPVDGVVTAVNASEGASAGRGQPVVEVADDSSGYQFSITADGDDASMLRIGDAVKVQLDEEPRRTVEGSISEIEDAAEAESGNKRITFDVLDAALKPGLKASVHIVNQSKSFGMQIPKDVLEQDNEGYFVYTVSEKDGPLGTAYYVSKTYITVKDENGDTVVADGLMPDESYVTESSEPIGDGDRVRY